MSGSIAEKTQAELVKLGLNTTARLKRKWCSKLHKAKKKKPDDTESYHRVFKGDDKQH